MAAPILSKKQQAACLKSIGKAKQKKAQLKNVLIGDNISIIRPKASKEVEDGILLKLSEILKGKPNIFKTANSISRKEQEEKRKVRVQLDLGTNCVCRSLEKDRLACVIVSGKVTPAPALDHVIAVAQQRGCPLLCLNDLSITLAKVTKSKCLPVCIGFKRPQSSCGLADFVEVISLVQQHTSVSKRSLRKLGATNNYFTKKTALPEALRPVCLDPSTDEAVREDLKKIFDNASINKVESRMMTPKERKRKKNKIKQTKTYYKNWFNNQFESGKKTVAQWVGGGKIQLIFVIRELLPVLMSEDLSSSLLCLARDQNCPVFGVSNLSMVMSPDPAKKLAVLGVKKQSALPADSQSVFGPVVEKCLNFMRTTPMPAQDMDVECSDSNNDVNTDSSKGDGGSDKPKPGDADYSFLYVLKKDSAELKEKAAKLKQERDNTSKQMTFSSDFISFSSDNGGAPSSDSGSLLGKRKSAKPLRSALMRPKRMNLDTEPEAAVLGDSTNSNSQKDAMEGVSDSTVSQKDTSIISDSDMSMSSTFSVSRSGDQQNKPKPNSHQEEVTPTQSSASTSVSNVFGLDPVQAMANFKQEAEESAEHVSNIFSATTRKAKGEDKKRHGQEGFLSFAYTEANIHTMVANPERKKKKKGGKT